MELLASQPIRNDPHVIQIYGLKSLKIVNILDKKLIVL